MTQFGPGNTGNPDWQPNARFSGAVLVNNETLSASAGTTYGPFYVGDSLSIGIICAVTNAATGFDVAVQWWADKAATQLIATQQYGGVASATVYDLIGNLGPYATVTLLAIPADPVNDWATTIIKTQSYPGTVLPLNEPVPLDIQSLSVGAGDTETQYATIITRAPMAYYLKSPGGADVTMVLGITDPTNVFTPLVEAAQLDASGNLFGQGQLQCSLSQLTAVLTNNSGGAVDMTACAVLL